MATREQIKANQRNAKLSSGPRRTDRTRFNGLKHGLRAEQVVLPGEDRAAFEAERQAWFDDWKPETHTRAVLVERALVASWKLRRATRVEAARLYDVAADVANEFDLSQKERVEGALRLLPRDPREVVARLRSDSAGLDCLIGLWDDLARAVEAGWTSRTDHHDRLLHLLGHPAGADAGVPEAGRASLVLLAAREPGAAAEVAGAAEALRALCAERSAELRRERSQYWDPSAYRKHLIDAAIAPTTKDAQLMHRYEREHEKALYAAIRGLVSLEKSGADLAEPCEAEPEPPPKPEAEAVAAPAGGDIPEKSDSTPGSPSTCGKLASVGESASTGMPSGRSEGSPGRPGRPIGADPGPKKAPKRR